jgi:hypothetical protein
MGVSEVFPGVSIKERISLIPTAKAWIFVVSPPFDLQRAWGPFFSALRKHRDERVQWSNQETRDEYLHFVFFEASGVFSRTLLMIPIGHSVYKPYATFHTFLEVFSTDNLL